MRTYRTNAALAIKGDRIERGEEIQLSEKEAARYGDDLTPVEAIPEEPAKEPEKPIEEMSYAELKAKAKELGLSASGTMADILERIQLHQAEADDSTSGNTGEDASDTEGDSAPEDGEDDATDDIASQ